jgi:transcriptional regulator of acetoin/glycerol metabolism
MHDAEGTLNEGSIASPSAAPRALPFLFVVLECGRPLAGGARFLLEGVDEIVIGRGAAREAVREGRRLVLRVPDRWMSGVHARIVRCTDGFALEDAQSKNGSLVNGERVDRAVLSTTDVVELGHTLFVVHDDVEVPGAGATGDMDTGRAPHALGTTTLLPTLAAELDAAARVAATHIPVLVLGETGTGKEVMARALHAMSARAGAFVAVNCGALPETLLESQLFGHVKGAFSGAVRDAPGFVRAADGGTLFLDEIGDLSLRSQAALLRVLQEREVVPVGATRPIKVDLRVLAATHRPLDELAARGEFRSDLFARLAGLRVRLPRLRDRMCDLGVLVADVLPAVAKDGAPQLSFSPAAGRALASYDWPLNIRELGQALGLAAALAPEGGVIDVAHLPPALSAARPAPAAAAGELSSEDERLRAELVAHLEMAKGNVSEVARAMGKQRTQIHRWVKRFGIDTNAFRR